MKPENRSKLLYGVLNIVQGALVGAIPLMVSSRIEVVNTLLMVVAGLMILAGPALFFGGTWGKRYAAGICILYWIAGLVGVSAVVFSASYLYGIYGRHGASAGGMAFVLAALLMVLFWLIPGHELHYLKKSGAKK